MILSMSEQTKLFMLTVLIGVAIGFTYDIFRIIRKVFIHPNFLIQIEDILYWALVSFGMFYFMLNRNDGEVRAYSIFGAFLGMILYYLTASPFIMKASVTVLNFFKKVLFTLLQIMLYPIKILLKIIKIPFNIVKNYIISAKKPVKKVLQKSGMYAKIRKDKISHDLKIIFKKV